MLLLIRFIFIERIDSYCLIINIGECEFSLTVYYNICCSIDIVIGKKKKILNHYLIMLLLLLWEEIMLKLIF